MSNSIFTENLLEHLPKNLNKDIVKFLNDNPEYKLNFNKLKNKYFVVTKSNNYFYHSDDILNTLYEMKNQIDQDYSDYEEDFNFVKDTEEKLYKKYYDDESMYKDAKINILSLDNYIKKPKWDIITFNTLCDVKNFFKKTTPYKDKIQECWECKKFFNNYVNFRCIECVCPGGYSEGGC